MKWPSKLLLIIFILGLIYSFFELVTAQDGTSAYYDVTNALTYSSIILFVASLIVLLINIKHLKYHLIAVFFLAISTPLTVSGIKYSINYLHYNRNPDLSVKYNMPVSREQYLLDSINIKMTIDSVTSENTTGIVFSTIDTIIYSEQGGKVFVSYINKVKNKWGYFYEPDYLVSDKRDSNNWELADSHYVVSGTFDSMDEVKFEVRKHYYNNFRFLAIDSTAHNYFWNAVL